MCWCVQRRGLVDGNKTRVYDLGNDQHQPCDGSSGSERDSDEWSREVTKRSK